ncbi:peptidylprolyl isomerase [Hydrogenophaga sp. PAMC20947]|uniref:peptidylprolyl isomerase n=1 Tax=Hydrogenophaga sp. PAMC20947 TaxID=2565558 RepID=UPI001FF7D32C|nr:peptidylprolyl isomerase [Hydrogenophaga sp. PAMC20947]
MNLSACFRALLLGGLVSSLGLPAAAQSLKLSDQMRAQAALPAAQSGSLTVDYIVALVNSAPITNNEVRQRLLRIEQQSAQQGVALPPRDELARQVMEQLVAERAQLQEAGDLGLRVDEASLLQAEQGIAAQNQLSLEDFRRRVTAEGLDIQRLRNELRSQLLLQRLREREVEQRVRVSEADIDEFIREQNHNNPAALELNLSHVLVQVPESAGAQQVSVLQAKAQRVADDARVAGADFSALARQNSDAPEAANGGSFGWRSANRLPPLFVEATRSLPVGGVAGPLRSAAGFHVLKLVEKRQGSAAAFVVTQSHARHILLRPGPQLTQAAAVAQLARWREQIASGQANFETLAREHSQDGSAQAGGDLDWVNPGQFVPEFEEVMDALKPGEMSAPVVSRFGVHLIRLEERRNRALTDREQRDAAKGMVREAKAAQALQTWSQDVRARAFVEFREPPRP